VERLGRVGVEEVVVGDGGVVVVVVVVVWGSEGVE
jgi:hypothetical protein